MKKICLRCKKEIDKTKDNYISLITYNSGEIIEEVYFHVDKRERYNCWGNFNQDKINMRLGQMTSLGQDLIKNMGLSR